MQSSQVSLQNTIFINHITTHKDRQPRARGKMHLCILITQTSYVGLTINRCRQSYYPLKPHHSNMPHITSHQATKNHAVGTPDNPACSSCHSMLLGLPTILHDYITSFSCCWDSQQSCMITSHHSMLLGLPTILHVQITPC